MPGFDRTGPMGAGPLTGGARGRCNPAVSGRLATAAGIYGRGLGSRRGFRGGFGRGVLAGRRYGRWNPSDSTTAPMVPSDEIEMLKAEADDMQRALETIQQRIQTLQKTSGEQEQDSETK